MSRSHCAALTALLAIACTGGEGAQAPTRSAAATPSALTGARPLPVPETAGPADHPAEREAVARAIAVALDDRQVRSAIYESIHRSRAREHKVHLQALLSAQQAQIGHLVAAEAGLNDAALSAAIAVLPPLELYLPVPEHYARWTGGSEVLVATSGSDHEAPVAFDSRGNRVVLDARTPPRTPVLAVVPAEQPMNVLYEPPQFHCMSDGCAPDPYAPLPPPPEPAPPPNGNIASLGFGSLYLRSARFVDDFEGWLRGRPEFEIHMMGPASAGSTELVTYQCIGEHAGGPYTWDMNNLTWQGNQLLFSGQQLNNFTSVHGIQGLVVYAVEDDDTACVVRRGDGSGTLVQTIANVTNLYYGLQRDSTNWGAVLRQAVSFGRSVRRLLGSDDDEIGIGVSDVVSGRSFPGTNWTVFNRANQPTGWLQLEVR